MAAKVMFACDCTTVNVMFASVGVVCGSLSAVISAFACACGLTKSQGMLP